MSIEGDKLRDEIKARADALAALIPATPVPPTQPPTIPPYQPPSGTKIINWTPGTKLEASLNQMDDGKPCEVHIPWGVTVPDGFTTYSRYGGASATARHVICTKPGGPRARLAGTLKLGVGDHPMRFVTVRDLDTPTKGIECYGYGNDIEFLNLIADGTAGTALIIQAEDYSTRRLTNVAVRFCLLSPSEVGMTHGLYAWGVDGLTIEDNVVDCRAAAGDMFDHNLYVQAHNTKVVVRRNTIMRGGDCQLRSDVELLDNLFLDMDCAAVLGCGTADENVAGGVTSKAQRNVVLRGRKGLHIGNVKSLDVSQNVWADATSTTPEAAYIQSGFAGCKDINWHHNVRRKHGGVGISYSLPSPLPGSTFTETAERTDLAGVNLALNSFGHSDLYAALRAGETNAGAIIAIVRSRLGMSV